jgi:peptidase E
MYMKLLLTSNGFTSSEIEQALDKFIDNRKNLKVAIIPTASDPIEWVLEKEGDVAPYDSVARLTKERDDLGEGGDYKYFKDKGHDPIWVDLKEDPKIIREKLQNVDIIDVPGGDANWLLDWAKKAGLGEYLKDLLDKGVIYIASSAGNGLLMPDIGLTWWTPRDRLDHIGFGIIDFCLVVHQKEDDSLKSINNLIELKKNYQANFPWKIYLVQDGQAIMVDGDNIEHIGPGTKKVV